MLSGLGLALTACSVTDRVSYGDQEGPIPQHVIDKIQNTKTEKAWVVAHLGEPFTIDRVETRGPHSQVLYEVYSYRLSRSSVRSGHVLYVFTMGGREDQIEYFHVAFEKSMVKKAWMDKFARAQLGTVLHQEKVKTVKVSSQKEADQVAKKREPVNWKLPILKKWFGSDEEGKHEDGSVSPREPESPSEKKAMGPSEMDQAKLNVEAEVATTQDSATETTQKAE